MQQQIFVSSEIGTLKRVMTHSPDGGIGKVVPTKAQDWLYEDIVDLQEMQQEYDTFKQVLLAFLDEPVLKQWFEKEEEFKRLNTSNKSRRPAFKKPDRPEFLGSDKVVEIQQLLVEILKNERVRDQLVASICAVERCDFDTQQMLSDKNLITVENLAKTLITGFMTVPQTHEERQIFPPLPNFIFTRDIGIVIDEYLLLSKTAKQARLRESILTKYIAYFELFPKQPHKVIEVTEDDEYFLCEDTEKESKVVTIEGGDLMMIAPQHLLIGYSERTSANAIDKIIKRLFSLKKADGTPLLKKISVIVIPKWRGTMHIDTIFTQVDRGTWVLHSPMSLEGQPHYNTTINYINDLDGKPDSKPQDMTGIRIVQFINEPNKDGRYRVNHEFNGLEDIMRHVSKEDFKHQDEVKFIYSGNAEYPYDEREQWTDACNVVAVQEGIVLGYDRNHKTNEAFGKAGFGVLKATEIVKQLKEAYLANKNADLTQLLHTIVPKKCLILIPSSELSRARGGTHCMTMPLWREIVQL
jgi:arginine deiminase